MTNERKKSIIILAITLVVGILMGLLVPGFFHKMETRGRYGDRDREQNPNRKREFAGLMNRVLKPDSAQAKQLQPIFAWAAIQIDSVGNQANQRMGVIFDSLKVQMKPILTAEQQKRLEEFEANAKEKWGGRAPGKY
jgi:Spy/CpxP family protein refolding chaperone